MPPELQLDQSVSVLNSQHFFDFVDHEEPEQRAVHVHLLHHNANFQPWRSQVVVQLRDRTLDNSRLQLDEKSSELLNWKMLDQDIEVRKVVFEIQPDEEAEKERRMCKVNQNLNRLAMAIHQTEQ